MSMNLPERLSAVAALAPQEWALEKDGVHATWGQFRDTAEALERLAQQAGVDRSAGIFVIIRNSLESALAVVGLLIADRPSVYVNAMQPEERRFAELRAMRPAMLVGARTDFTPQLCELLAEIGAAAAAFDDDLRLSFLADQVTAGAGPFYAPDPGTALVMQTSGTTGEPKRIALSQRLVLLGMMEGARGRAGGGIPKQVQRSPALMFAPMFHASGTFALLMSIYEARPVILFDKFRVDTFQDAVKKYEVRFVSLPPTMIRMILDSDLTREDLSSLLAVRSGTAPLSPDVQRQFEDRFGVPVLITYGATEFMGALARWTIDDHKVFAEAKRGSVGRISPGVELRIVDPDSGGASPPGEAGVIEVKGKRVGADSWVRTNDLGRVDEHGFLYILGRVDDAIVRGGFKILAGQVAEVLSRHERVQDAAVIGIPDPRLGELPVAIVEPRPEGPPPTPEEVIEFARKHLVAYQVPAKVLVVPELPRTVSMKISRPEVRAMFEKASV